MNNAGAETGKRPYRMVARADAAEGTAARVLDVAVELFTDNAYDDVALEDVAQQAQVTKRTVIRRFGSKETLFVAAMDRAAEEEVRRREAAPVDDIPGAVANLVDHYERFGRNRLRLLSQEDRITVVAENVASGRRYHRSWVERTFPSLIGGRTGTARKRRVAALVVVTDVYTWKLLRRDLGLSRSDTERTIVELMKSMEGGT